MTPEGRARQKIDLLLRDAGWQIVSRNEFSPTISAVAVEEGF